MTGTDTAAPVEGKDPGEPTAAPRRLGYMPALDGLRAVAITLVVLFHYPWIVKPFHTAPMHGGFLGVDMFFVLSGFLITTLLLEERQKHGRVSLKGFYQRRARRLLPAFFVLFVIALIEHFVFSLQPTTTGLLGMLVYMANWVQIWRPDSLGPIFGHTWSLAIEEQFYLLFPLILIGLIRLGLRRVGLAVALFGGALAAWGWRVAVWHRQAASKVSFVDFYALLTGRSLPDTDPFRFREWNRWYFGTDTRADALLVGCAAAVIFVWLARRPARRGFTIGAAVVAMLAFVGGGIVVARATIPSGWIPDWGLFVLESCVALTVLGLAFAPRAPLARVLSLPPLVYLGRRSYAIYLFHLFIFQQLRTQRTHLGSVAQFWLLMAVTLLVAELSWRYIESPFMRGRRRYEREPAAS
ncbi:MAG TPA: acyltransferase [Acidimicrobiia bacterium]|jgi:peptidoglycan/LPS O-acetylase OafA/YrhL